MNRIIETETFQRMNVVKTQNELITTFKEVTELILNLNQCVENTVLRSNILFRTQTELMVWIELSKKKSIKRRENILSSGACFFN